MDIAARRPTAWEKPFGWQFTWVEWNRYRRHFTGCAFCGGPQQTICALVAWRYGGSKSIGNAVPACKGCVKAKGQRYVMKWRKEQIVHIHARRLEPAAFALKYGLDEEHRRFLRRQRIKHAEYRRRAELSRSLSYREYAEDNWTNPVNDTTWDWDADDPEWGERIRAANGHARLLQNLSATPAPRRNGLT